MNEALKRPEVAAMLNAARAALEGDISQLRQIAQLAAIETAMQLMRESKDEKIRARIAEFLANEGKSGVPVRVNLDLRQTPLPTGYRYIRPTTIDGENNGAGADTTNTCRSAGTLLAADEVWQCREGFVLIDTDAVVGNRLGILLNPGDSIRIANGKTVYYRVASGTKARVSRVSV